MQEISTSAEHFRDTLACRCGCGLNRTSSEFAGQLFLALSSTGHLFKILEAYRCPIRNSAMGRPLSSIATSGEHADIKYSSPQDLYALVVALLGVGFERLRIYPNHVHVDRDPNFPVPSIEWRNYPPDYPGWNQ